LKKINKGEIKDVSSGGVVFHISENKIPLFLLLKHNPGGHWDVPKGHLEGEETFEQTAFREVVEESGIGYDKLLFIQRIKHQNHYTFWYKGKKMFKTVHLFLFQSLTDKIILSKEHSNYLWVKQEEIKDRLTFETSLPAFQEAFIIIKRLNQNKSKNSS
jgi:tRNA nucleotidyltransferase (CCA-adding enzyme)